MNWHIPHTGITVFQEIFVPICAFLALRAALRTWGGRTPRVSGFLAIGVWLTAAIAIAIPDSTSYLANKVGINRGADFVLYISILAGLGVCFYFYQRTRQLENLITASIRREALRNVKIGRKSVDESPFAR